MVGEFFDVKQRQATLELGTTLAINMSTVAEELISWKSFIIVQILHFTQQWPFASLENW